MANKRTIAGEPMRGNLLRVGPLALSLTTRYLVVGDSEPIYLRPKEAALLHLLMQHPGEVLPHEDIWRAVWGTNSLGDRRSLHTHMHWLRQKIAPAHLRTVRGVGYRLDVDAKPCYNSTQQQDTSCCGNREDTETS